MPNGQGLEQSQWAAKLRDGKWEVAWGLQYSGQNLKIGGLKMKAHEKVLYVTLLVNLQRRMEYNEKQSNWTLKGVITYDERTALDRALNALRSVITSQE